MTTLISLFGPHTKRNKSRPDRLFCFFLLFRVGGTSARGGFFLLVHNKASFFFSFLLFLPSLTLPGEKSEESENRSSALLSSRGVQFLDAYQGLKGDPP